ncbi:MAG TPA: hypothetical protein VKU37_07465 [Verrucomicrobiae bacterium]|nr:hypothetical protein [Verrucomicrobiae bacterium]
MKLIFSKSIGRFRVKSLLLWAGWLLCPLMVMGTDPIFINTGSINGTPPNVDATNFYNSGTWNIFTSAAYETANTQNYTNVGTMTGAVGWEFDFGTSTSGGPRSMSASFFNDSSGTIQGVDGMINPIGNQIFTVSYLLVSATNIVNKGTLAAGPNGVLALNGGTVNLALSQVMITSPSLGGGGFSGTNFTLDTGLYAETWAQTNMPANLPGGVNMPLMNISSLWNGTIVSTPFYGVLNNCTTNYSGTSQSFAPTVSDSLDNLTSPSNEVRQAVFVITGDSNITAQIRFTPSSTPTNYFQTAAIRLAATLTNAFTLAVETNSVYLVDRLGSETNLGLYVNSNVSSFYSCSGPLYQPQNYIVSRTDPTVPQTGLAAFGNGTPGLGPPAATFFNDPSLHLTMTSVSNTYSAYSVFVDDLAADPSGTLVTNLPGRIQINANNLNLSRTFLGSQGSISVQASNLVTSAGAVVDCQNLTFNLGSTNGFLTFTNLAKLNVSRLKGTINAWSGLWTNSVVVGSGTNAVTNFIDFSILVVDASGLTTRVPVTVQNLILHSTNMTVGDSMDVDQSLLLDGQSFTLSGEIVLSGSIQNWDSSVAPTLRNFTNNGYLFIPNNAHFGDDTATNYATFVNHGTISAGSQTINSSDLELYGTSQTTVGDFTATMQTGKVVNAVISSAAGIKLFANTLQVNQSLLAAAGALNLSVTNLLTDNGAANVFSCNGGFNLLIKPAAGDLLGTTFQTIAASRSSVTHTWAGQDLGPTAAGFSNNAAIGSLVLEAGGNGTPFQEPEFTFSGTGASNGLYVAYLDISKLTNYNFLDGLLVSISPNLTIYFGSASTNPAALNGQFGGHLVYVPGFAGQNTKLSGSSYNHGTGAFQFSVASASGQTNVVQASTNFVNWIPIGTNIGPLLFSDPNAKNFPYRFYRIKIGP